MMYLYSASARSEKSLVYSHCAMFFVLSHAKAERSRLGLRAFELLVGLWCRNRSALLWLGRCEHDLRLTLWCPLCFQLATTSNLFHHILELACLVNSVARSKTMGSFHSKARFVET